TWMRATPRKNLPAAQPAKSPPTPPPRAIKHEPRSSRWPTPARPTRRAAPTARHCPPPRPSTRGTPSPPRHTQPSTAPPHPHQPAVERAHRLVGDQQALAERASLAAKGAHLIKQARAHVHVVGPPAQPHRHALGRGPLMSREQPLDLVRHLVGRLA